MPNPVDENEEREQQLDALIAEYYRLDESGEAPDHKEFIAQHPDFAQELTEFFADVLILHGQNRPAPQDPALEPTVTAGTSQRNRLAAGAAVRYFGVYEILEELGAGGMGVVYKARHARLRKLVALKMIKAGALASEFEVKMFEAEARAAAKLDHPGIVAVHEVGLHAGQHFYSMDYVTGGGLSKLHRDEPVPAKRAAELVKQLAEAIHYAHEQGIVHRDLKPANILLTADGVPRITDFGLAKRLWAGDESIALSMTETGQILGTAGYMSPEQAEGKTKLVGPPADIYALGAVLYALLTSRAPFVGESQADTIRQVIEKEPVSPRVLNPSLPRDLETICLKCLSKERHERYGTAQLLAEDLSAFLDGRPIAARPIGYIGRTAKWIRRHRLVSSLLLLTCVSMLIGTVFSVHFGITARQEAKEADKARTEATQSLAEVELSDYLNRVALAQTEWQADNVKGCEELLDACPVHLRGWEWNYLKRLCHTGILVTVDMKKVLKNSWHIVDKERSQTTISDKIYGLAYSGDRSQIITKVIGSLDTWDANTGEHVNSLQSQNSNTAKHFAYDPKQNVVLFDNQIVDAKSFQHVGTLLNDESFAYEKAAFSLDGLQLALGTTPIRVMNPMNGELLCELPSPDGTRIESLAFSPSGEYLAIGRQGAMQVWSLPTKEIVFSELNGGQQISFDGSGELLIAGCGYLGLGGNSLAFPDIRIWKVPTFQLIRTLSSDRGGSVGQRIFGGIFPNGPVFAGPYAGTHAVAICSASQQLGVLSRDKSIRLFNLQHAISLESSRAHSDGLSEEGLFDAGNPQIDEMRLRAISQDYPVALAFDSQGKRLVTAATNTAGRNAVLQTWDISHPQEAKLHGMPLKQGAKSGSPTIQIGDTSVAVCYGIRRPLSNGDHEFKARIRTIDAAGGPINECVEDIESDRDFHLSGDGRTIAVLAGEHLYVRSVIDQNDILVIDVVNHQDHMFCLDEKGKRFALQSDGHLRIWDVTSGQELCEIGPTAGGRSDHPMGTFVCFDPSGERIATSFTLHGGVDIWDVTTAQLLATIPVKGVRKLFHATNRLIVLNDEQITCWLLPEGTSEISGNPAASNAGKPILRFQKVGMTDRIFDINGDIAVSADLTRIAVRTSDSESIVTVLDAMSGTAIGEVLLAQRMPFCLSPDGRRMIAVKSDGQLHLHHVDGNRDILNLSILGISLSEFTSDGNKIFGVSEDGIVRVLDGTPWEGK